MFIQCIVCWVYPWLDEKQTTNTELFSDYGKGLTEWGIWLELKTILLS